MSDSRFWTLTGEAFQEGAAVPLTDRGFRYGMSVFETFAVRDGAILFAEEHFDRLSRAARAAEIDFPESLSRALVGILPPGETGMLRIYLTAGDGSPLHPVTTSRVYALFDSIEFPSTGESEAGMRLSVYRAPLPCVLEGWKTGNYWMHVQALSDARRQGCGEAIVLNQQGAIVSASIANIFFLLDGRLQTPALPCGPRDGVVRRWVMQQIPVEESLLSVEDLERVEECFVTNSRLGVMPVTAIEETQLPSRATGDQLCQIYREAFLSH